MINNSNCIGLIPARAGSKGIVNKNLIDLHGQSPVFRAIMSSISCKYIDETYLLSDSDLILDVGKSLNVNLIKRTKISSSDRSTATDVLLETFENIPSNFLEKDPYVVYLQPSSPLRNANHIEQAIELMLNENNSLCLSVSRNPIYFSKLIKLSNLNRATTIYKELFSSANRQDMEEAFLPNGAIYIFKYSHFKTRKTFPILGSSVYKMNVIDSLDLNEEKDLMEVASYLDLVHGCQ